MRDKCVTATQAAYDLNQALLHGPSLHHAPGERYVAVHYAYEDVRDIIDTRTERVIATGVSLATAITILKRLNSGKPTASVFGGL